MVIIFDDISRVTRIARIAPFVISELAAAGTTDDRIKFICALGSHGARDRNAFAKKLGEAIVARFHAYNYKPFYNCSYVRTTHRVVVFQY